MERLTIDEAIMHAREVARESKNHATYTFPSLETYYDECKKCAEEYEQLAEWLEELKHYKDLEEQGRLIEVVKCKDCSCFEKITAAHNYYFCNRYGGIVTENDYCSRAEAKLKEMRGEQE